MERTIDHSGFWGIAVITIVIVSWMLYRYLAPKTWREWAGAGLIQAFIIALYAEMFGFPLTIYLLVRFFGLDRVYLNANLWSTLLGMGETGMMISMMLGYTLLIAGIGVFVRGWTLIYRARKNNSLVIQGLYSQVRHPQYAGLFIALFGEGVIHWPTIFSVGLFPAIVTAYVLLARKEEQRMVEIFGAEYREYQGRVPMFIPSYHGWKRLLTHPDISSGTSR